MMTQYSNSDTETKVLTLQQKTSFFPALPNSFDYAVYSRFFFFFSFFTNFKRGLHRLRHFFKRFLIYSKKKYTVQIFLYNNIEISYYFKKNLFLKWSCQKWTWKIAMFETVTPFHSATVNVNTKNLSFFWISSVFFVVYGKVFIRKNKVTFKDFRIFWHNFFKLNFL